MTLPMAYVEPKGLLVVEGCPSSRPARSTHAVQYLQEHLPLTVAQQATVHQGLTGQDAMRPESWPLHQALGERQAWDICW